jgi:hypothetical protein
MSRDIDPTQAKKWDEEELETNVRYLEQRNRWDDLRVIEETLGKSVTESAPEPEPDSPEGTNETADVPFEDLSKGELKAIAEERGLAVSGSKSDLIERLTEEE